MVFAALSGTPCVALDNISKKVSGVYDGWMKPLSYVRVIKDADELKVAVREVLSFSTDARARMMNDCRSRILDAGFMALKEALGRMV